MHYLLQGTFQIAMNIVLLFVFYFVVVLFTYVFLSSCTFSSKFGRFAIIFSFTFIDWLPLLICACSQRKDKLQNNNLNIES